jgi:hypothetical protein
VTPGKCPRTTRTGLLQRAADEYMALSLMSYSGTSWGGMVADLNEDDVRQIRLLVLELATALSEECGVPIPAAELVL